MARPKDPNARAALIAAARREFVTHGLLKARIEDVTQACGLSKGAFYLHFESKEALFRDLVETLQGEVGVLVAERQRAYQELVEAARTAQGREALARRLSQLDVREDLRLLELLWAWRDVADVLLRGCQGTEFEGVVWHILDLQGAMVRQECAVLQQAGLMRADVSPEVVAMMVIGTYLLVARRLVQAAERPDFEELVLGLQRVMASGTFPLAAVPSPPRRTRRARARVTASRKKRSHTP